MAEAATLTYRGLQVPWVTRWTKEIAGRVKVDVALEDGQLRVRYADGIEYRDKHGVLWQREGIMRGGEPQFAHVSGPRQRTCMRKQLCQVCGKRITDRPIRWLMDPGQLTLQEDGTGLTVSPPTCSSCVDVALDACPHLRTNERLILTVLEYRVWGVWGDVVYLDPNKPTADPGSLQRTRMNVPYDQHWPLGSVLAKQQVAQLIKFTTEKVSP